MFEMSFERACIVPYDDEWKSCVFFCGSGFGAHDILAGNSLLFCRSLRGVVDMGQFWLTLSQQSRRAMLRHLVVYS